MSNNYINFYNNLIHLTRNKKLYNDFTNHDTFSDRLVIFLFHFAFFLNIFKSDQDKKTLQNKRNLCKHIGWGPDSTRGKGPDDFPEIKREQINFPLSHPISIEFKIMLKFNYYVVTNEFQSKSSPP